MSEYFGLTRQPEELGDEGVCLHDEHGNDTSDAGGIVVLESLDEFGDGQPLVDLIRSRARATPRAQSCHSFCSDW
jgi:hypothetical protein